MKGVGANNANDRGVRPMHIACQTGNSHLVQRLLELGEKIFFKVFTAYDVLLSMVLGSALHVAGVGVFDKRRMCCCDFCDLSLRTDVVGFLADAHWLKKLRNEFSWTAAGVG